MRFNHKTGWGQLHLGRRERRTSLSHCFSGTRWRLFFLPEPSSMWVQLFLWFYGLIWNFTVLLPFASSLLILIISITYVVRKVTLPSIFLIPRVTNKAKLKLYPLDEMKLSSTKLFLYLRKFLLLEKENLWNLFGTNPIWLKNTKIK